MSAHDYTADVRDRAEAAIAAVAELVEAVRDVYGDDCEQVCETSCPTCRIRRALTKFGGAACTLRDARPAPQQPAPVAPVGVEASYHPCTHILIEGLKRLEGGAAVLAEWDRARAQADAALAQQPAAVDEVVRAAVLAEREACARACDDRAAYYHASDDDGPNTRRGIACEACASVIRWRSTVSPSFIAKHEAEISERLATQHQEPPMTTETDLLPLPSGNVAHLIAAQSAEIEALRALAGYAYQMAGFHNAPVVWLDRLSQAANGEKLPDPDTLADELLPYQPDASSEVEALRAEVELWRHKAAVHQYRRKRLAEALRWYAEQAAGCRKIGRDGDAARAALDADGGGRARAALEQEACRG